MQKQLCYKNATWCMIGAVMLSLTGCNGSPLDLAPVTGTVTYRAKPLDHGTVVFMPAEGTHGPQAIGVIEPDGSFTMTTADHDGAAIGRHKVSVHCRRVVTPKEARNLVVGELLIPQRYARFDQTPLMIEVKNGGNTLPIELKD